MLPSCMPLPRPLQLCCHVDASSSWTRRGPFAATPASSAHATMIQLLALCFRRHGPCSPQKLWCMCLSACVSARAGAASRRARAAPVNGMLAPVRWRRSDGAHQALTPRGAAQARALARQAEARSAGRGASGRHRPEQRHLLARLALDAERGALAAERAGEAREAAAGRAAAAAAQRCGALPASTHPLARTCTAFRSTLRPGRRHARECDRAASLQHVHGCGGGSLDQAVLSCAVTVATPLPLLAPLSSPEALPQVTAGRSRPRGAPGPARRRRSRRRCRRRTQHAGGRRR